MIGLRRYLAWLALMASVLAVAPEAAAQTTTRPPDLPVVTEADRRAAFPDVDGHAIHDRAINYFVLADQLEWQSGSEGRGVSWDTKGWIGGDRTRFWFRSEGERESGALRHGELHALYTRPVGRWWDVVAGLRQDFRPGSPQSWAAIGVQGLAPYWFEIEATAYVGAGGRTQFRVEAEYELLLTNRLVAQPLIQVELYGKQDAPRGIGSGLGALESGLRLRYEITREFAPYLGVTWDKKFFGTADFAKSAGERVSAAKFTIGVRTWF